MLIVMRTSSLRGESVSIPSPATAAGGWELRLAFSPESQLCPPPRISTGFSFPGSGGRGEEEGGRGRGEGGWRLALQGGIGHQAGPVTACAAPIQAADSSYSCPMLLFTFYTNGL